MPTQHTWYEEEKKAFDKGYRKAIVNNKFSDKEEFDTWEDGHALEWSKKWIQSHDRRLLDRMEKGISGIEEYIVVKDNDTHRYEIPRSKKEEWDIFCDIPIDDEASWDVPEWAECLDGMPVRSFKESVEGIITTLKNEIK